jgi:hypothetical protein
MAINGHYWPDTTRECIYYIKVGLKTQLKIDFTLDSEKASENSINLLMSST